MWSDHSRYGYCLSQQAGLAAQMSGMVSLGSF